MTTLKDQNLGNSLPSGSNEEKAKKKKVNWKEMALERGEMIRELERKLEHLAAEKQAVEDRIIDPRSKVKLRALEHFYGRVLNAQVNPEAKKVLDDMITEAQWVIKKGFEHG